MSRLFIFFTYTLFLAFLLPIFFPQLYLIYFAPFLVASFYRQKKIKCLWLAFLCGFLIDLFSTQTRLGFYALTYFLTAEILYNQQRNFFEDRFSTLPIMTFLFAIISTVIQIPLLYAFDIGLDLSMEWFKNDLILNPLYDAIYAALAFTLPSIFFYRTKPRQTTMLRFKGER